MSVTVIVEGWRSLMELSLCPLAGGHGSWEGVAPGALCVHRVRDRVRQSQLLWEGRPAVLRVGLLHPLLPSLRAMQQAHFEREGRFARRDRLDCPGPPDAVWPFILLVVQKMVTALDKNWHPECFCCVKCSRAFGEEGNGRHTLHPVWVQHTTLHNKLQRGCTYKQP